MPIPFGESRIGTLSVSLRSYQYPRRLAVQRALSEAGYGSYQVALRSCIQFVQHPRGPQVSCMNRLVCIGPLPIQDELYRAMTVVEELKTLNLTYHSEDGLLILLWKVRAAKAIRCFQSEKPELK